MNQIDAYTKAKGFYRATEFAEYSKAPGFYRSTEFAAVDAETETRSA